MNNSFLSALQSKAQAVASTPKPKAQPTVPNVLANACKIDLIANITVNLSRNTLTVLLKDQASPELFDLMYENGFKIGPDHGLAQWEGKYTKDAVDFLVKTFQVEGLNPPVEVKPIQIEIAPEPVQPEPVEAEEEQEVSETYKQFKAQVNALQAELKLDAADLMLKAVACLYNETFKVN